MLACRAYIPDDLLPPASRIHDRGRSPCRAWRRMAEEGMVFERPITFLVGENGSGKSTAVEAFAEAWGLDARGGRAGRNYVNDRPKRC